MSMLHALSLAFLAISGVGLAVVTAQDLLAWWYLRRSPRRGSSLPWISILKPLCGVDDDLQANVEHFATLPYPNYELLLGVKSAEDPAYPLAVEAARRWPDRVRLFLQRGEPGLNPKVNQLITLQAEARHDLLLVSDSNCRTPPGYLEEIAAEFEDPEVGCVTNPIVGIGERRLGSLLDNFHLGSSIAPGMVAPKVSPVKQDIVVGKSMALRRRALEALGGFHAARNVLAEDWVLGLGVRDRLHLKITECRLPVFQVSQDRSVSDFLDRHRRWCVIHRSLFKTSTYLAKGLLNVVPHALLALVLWPSRLTLCCFAAACAWKIAADSLATRLFRPKLFGAFTPAAVLLKDLLLELAWLHGLFVRTVNWRGNVLRVHRGSLLVPEEAAPALPAALGPDAADKDRSAA